MTTQPEREALTIGTVEQVLTVEYLERIGVGARVVGAVTARYRPPVSANGMHMLSAPRPATWLLEPAIDDHTRIRLCNGAPVDQLLIVVPDPADTGRPPGTVHEAADRILEELARHRTAIAAADAALTDVIAAVRRACGDVPVAPTDNVPPGPSELLCGDCDHPLDDHDADGCELCSCEEPQV